jgi:predicted SnoaL-like aldol condensation-catalyzing enzyme
MDVRSDSISPMAVVGFSAAEEDLYRAVLRNSPVTYDVLSRLVGAPVPEVAAWLDRFASAGLVEVRGDTVVASAPERALARMISDEGQRLRSVQDQLDALQRMLPGLTAEHMVARQPRGEVVGVESIAHSEVIDVVRSLTARSTGDLLWIRPDQWRIPEGAAVDLWVQELLRSGRKSRVIYPARVLEEAPEMVRGRAQLGEHVRLLAEVPGRLAVMGSAAALIPDRFDLPDEQLLIIRQPALVAALTQLFESLWERALAVPGLDAFGADDDAVRASDRRLLLDQLARGAKDEQIGRTLGLSLRTVRRRVADVLDELEASSRFQAGVEAVRRGWL